MDSHESYYTSTAAAQVPLPTPSPTAVGVDQVHHHPPPPPPPPPKPHDTSRTNTPTVPPVSSQPNASSFATTAATPPQHQSGSPAQRPPPPRPPPPPQKPQSPAHQGQEQNHNQTSYQQQQQQQQQPPPPPPPASTRSPSHHPSSGHIAPAVIPPALDSGWLPETLKEYSTADLQTLPNDPELLDAFAKQHPAYASAMEPLQAAIATNLALAQHVVQLEGQINQLRERTGQLLLNHTSLQTQWRRKQSEMDDALSSWGPRAMYSRLVSSINEQEAILRAVHESFVEGGGEHREFQDNGSGKSTEKELTEWVKRIREGTTLLEKRREMRQRWDEGRVGGWR